jgi:hypothetical protein
MMTPTEERDKALAALDPFWPEVSLVFRECYLSAGIGALLVYTDPVINGTIPTEDDYLTKNDVLEMIDGKDSKAGLAALLSKYDPHTEGILVFITSATNATFFHIVKLISRHQVNEEVGKK